MARFESEIKVDIHGSENNAQGSHLQMIPTNPLPVSITEWMHIHFIHLWYAVKQMVEHVVNPMSTTPSHSMQRASAFNTGKRPNRYSVDIGQQVISEYHHSVRA